IATSYSNTGVASTVTLKNSSSAMQSFAYADTPDSEIATETDTPSSPKSPSTYVYDGKNRIVSMTPGSNPALNYSFDASGNLTILPGGAAATYNDAGELASSSSSGASESYTYNADGERLTATEGSVTVNSATWNGADQLVSYASPSADMTSASYNGNNLRSTAVSVPTGGSATTQDFVWDTADQASSFLLMDSGNAYIYAMANTPLEQVNLSTGAVSYLVADALGSVRGIVSGSGSLTATTSYDAWGNPMNSGGLTSSTPFGFAGGYTDPSGLVYLMNRYYDPQTGQFTSIDPDISQTLQPYQYAYGNPVNLTDPSGLKVGNSVGQYHCALLTSVNSSTMKRGNEHGRMCMAIETHISPSGSEGVRGWLGFRSRSKDGLQGVFSTTMWLRVCIAGVGCDDELTQDSMGNENIDDSPAYALIEAGWYIVNSSAGPGNPVGNFSIQSRAWGLTMGWYNTDQIACYGGCNWGGWRNKRQTLDSDWLYS
ncbi:MAG TPA: RHS repeat-associated core domain-containing protein, partial [Streptosporangiaceae bacterium]|nr:RHS repeat-associated core domain-containing protein [Streptosporangiaceae bacterium]